MKKIFLLLLLCLCIGESAYAQLSIGPKFGLNLFRVNTQSSIVNDLFEYKYGGVVGFFAKYAVSSKFSVQSELLYSQQGYKEKAYYVSNMDSPAEECTLKSTTHCFNIPILMKFYPYEGFNLEVGPQVGFNIAQNRSFSTSSSLASEEDLFDDPSFKTVDFAVILGLGYEFNNRITTSLRYNLGLTPMTDELFGKAYNRGFQLSVGYMFDVNK